MQPIECAVQSRLRTGKSRTLWITQRASANSDVVAVPRFALEVLAGEVNAAIEGAVRRLGYTVPTTDVVTEEWMFSSPSPRVGVNRCVHDCT